MRQKSIMTRLVAATALLLMLVGLVAVRPEPAAALSCGPCPATTTDALNLRAEPSLAAEVLLVIPAGASLEWDPLQGEVDGFVAVTYDGTSGWSHSDYLFLFPTGATTTTALNLRTGSSLDAEVLTVMPAGAQVMVLGGPENGFFAVRYEPEQLGGWAWADYLDLADRSSGGGEFPAGSLVAVDTDALNLRVQPGLGSEVLAVLPTGAEGTVLAPPTDADGYTWYQVDFGSQYGAGWVAGEFLAYVSEGGFAIGDAVVTTDALNYRTEPGLGAEVIEVLAAGTEGAILDGPVYADGYTWYQLGLPGYGPDGAAPGWVAGEFLASR